MCLLAPTPPLRRHHKLLYVMFSSPKVLVDAWSKSSTAFHACAAHRLHPSCCAEQNVELSLDAKQKLYVLMSLANNCRLQASDADFILLCCAVLGAFT